MIGEGGEQLGIMSRNEALDVSEDKGLDLVLISPNAKPPVAKIMDYGKYRYEQQKKEKEAKKKQKIIQVKEIRLSVFIEEHDLQVKAKNAIKFLKEGDKVKTSLRFRGRERGHTNQGMEVMLKFAGVVDEYGTPEKAPKLEGRQITMVLTPRNENKK